MFPPPRGFEGITDAQSKQRYSMCPRQPNTPLLPFLRWDFFTGSNATVGLEAGNAQILKTPPSGLLQTSSTGSALPIDQT